MAFLGTMQAKIIGALLVVAAIGSVILYIYHKGENAGSSDVKAKVATETVKTLDKARSAKEQADHDTAAKPFGERVDGLK